MLEGLEFKSRGARALSIFNFQRDHTVCPALYLSALSIGIQTSSWFTPRLLAPTNAITLGYKTVARLDRHLLAPQRIPPENPSCNHCGLDRRHRLHHREALDGTTASVCGSIGLT